MFQILLAIIYLAFISLGLPDAMLGSAWPEMHKTVSVPLSYAGILSAIIAAGTIFSSIQSDRVTLKMGSGKVTAFSVLMTAAALFGFSISRSFYQLCLWAIPYGLGAGSVDAALNNFVAVHYKSRHMSWLHCMWGVGAATGPYIMGYALSKGYGWPAGYKIISIIQIMLTVILFLSLSLWNINKKTAEENSLEKREVLKIKDIFKIKGTKEVFICFFCYCAIEQTTGLWASSYLNIYKGLSVESSASFAAMFYIGITLGRAISGFLTIKLSDLKMIRLGQFLIFIGAILLILPLNIFLSLAGFIVIGLGCAPIYPCIIHSTPFHFGKDKSQAIIGMQMAFAYTGTLTMPPLFGIIAKTLNINLLPVYLFILLILMIVMHERLNKVTSK